jgi:5-oxoprolinase (ATP-hydrolysing)
MSKWQFWIDRGGTFTDVVAKTPSGALITHKLLSDNPELYEDAAIEGIRRLLKLNTGEPISAETVESVKMGTTVATNALLERKGEPTVLLVTRGFRDALRIGYQNRPRLFDRHIVLPTLLYTRVIEVNERLDARGEVLRALDVEDARQQLQHAYDDGFRALAVTLMHAYRYPAHELLLEGVAADIGYTQISISHKVSPLIRFVSRGDTTGVDAYLSPILRRYIDRVASQMSGVRVLFMQSNGGLTRAHRFQGKDAILSGPAGGIIGMVRTAQSAGFTRIIGFDMGGTSTDVSHFAGEFERQLETQIAGVRMRTPIMNIHTVAAGGGSILHFDGGRLRVGPDSAAANPGPAAYRRGGPLTVTDCNVMLGRIQPSHFPRVFGRSGSEPLDIDIVREKFTALAEQISAATGSRRAPEQIAEAYIGIAVRNMANAIRRVSVERGYDVSGYVLNTFGGAGGQHACGVADQLGMTRVLLHPLAGVLSAYGIGLADITAMRESSVEMELTDDAIRELERRFMQTEREAGTALLAQDVPPERIRFIRHVHLRYEGTDTAVPIVFADRSTMLRAFAAAYRQRFSFLLPDRAVIAATLAVEAIGSANAPAADASPLPPRASTLTSSDVVRVYCEGRWQAAPLYLRDKLLPGDRLRGPAIIAEHNSTTLVDSGWHAEITTLNHLLMTRVDYCSPLRASGTGADPMLLEVFANLFMSIAEQMGLRLQQSAHSVNIKERLDFSCAIFDENGNLLANAPHMPVHLGSMSETIKTVIRENAGAIRAGDAFAINDPYRGGTHLPDITVITPVFGPDGRSIEFYVGSRGHHADIGGITPGSMPSDSRQLHEEGILFSNWRLVDGGELRESETLGLLSSGPYPARNPAQNLADLRAQVAANAKGAEEIHRMIADFGLETVRAYTQHVQDNAEEAVRSVIGSLKDGAFRLEMDSGCAIQVSIRVDRSRRCAVIDFTGTSQQLPDNFNAPASITVAAVLFVFRSLVDRDIPLNAGCLKPLQIIVPEGSMLNPRFPAAVVAGNVETSQCVTNALFAALGAGAASQCTMNNFSFGDECHQYYETVAGGSGAGPGYAGTDVVQTNMTNSRITDPEVLESRYPVIVDGFEIRADSGGDGHWRGGCGATRRIRFLAPMSASILSNNRHIAPFGLQGGHSGALGRNLVQRLDGRNELLSSCATVALAAGETFVIETPGGGGFGAPRACADLTAT